MKLELFNNQIWMHYASNYFGLVDMAPRPVLNEWANRKANGFDR